MLSDIFYGAENVRRVIITVLVLVGIWSTYCIHRLETNVVDLQNNLTQTNLKLEEANKEIEKLQAYCKELEASDDMDKAEFLNVWRSLGHMRNNFVALGKGYHLDKEDICPEEECREEYAGIKSKEEL